MSIDVDELVKKLQKPTKIRRYFSIGIRVFMLYLAIASTIAFAEFMYEEAAQQAGFGIFQCSNALRGASANETVYFVEDVCNQQLTIADSIGKTGSAFTESVGWIMPLNWESYRTFWRGFQSNLQTNHELLHILGSEQETKLLNKPSTRTFSYEYMTLTFTEKQYIDGTVTKQLASYAVFGWHVMDELKYYSNFPNGFKYVVILERVIITTIPG